MLCRSSVMLDPYAGYPYPSTAIANATGMSLYAVRKELKRLKELGLVQSACVCEYSDWDCMNHIIRGYVLTESGKQTEEYKTAFAEEVEIVKQIFGFDISKNGGDFDE